VDQGEASPVGLQGGSSGFGDPQEPGQQVTGVGDGSPELADGPGDHLTVNSQRLIPRGDNDNPGMLAPQDRAACPGRPAAVLKITCAS
jgi:hypothetical protein